MNNTDYELESKKSINENKKVTFKYRVENKKGQKFYGYLDALDKDSVIAYLKNDGYNVISVEKQNKLKSLEKSTAKLKDSEIAFMLTQLSTYLKAGISLIDAVKILEKQSVKPSKKRIYSNIIYELSKGENLSSALEKSGNVFPIFLINMIKTSELTGDLVGILDDMQNYYDTKDKNRKQAINVMTYPMILFFFTIIVLVFIFTYVLPSFVTLFETQDATLPTFTKVVLAISGFLTAHKCGLLIALILLVLSLRLLYKYVRKVRRSMQIFAMKLPVIGKIIIYREVTMFTKTFATLLNHNVFITDSISVLETISNNEVFKDVVKEALDRLSKGESISSAFEDEWVFPVVAYEMLVTGENTGKLGMMMKYVSDYYEDLSSSLLKRLNSFIEPVLILFIAIVVGAVVISVIVPMFNFYGTVL